MARSFSLLRLHLGLVACVLSTLVFAGLLGSTASSTEITIPPSLVARQGSSPVVAWQPRVTRVAPTPPSLTAVAQATASGGPTVRVSQQPLPFIAPVPAPAPITSIYDLVGTGDDADEPALTLEEQGLAAVANINFDLASLGYTMSFHENKNGYLGLNLASQKRIEIYIRPGISEEDLTFVIAHEFGHAVDHIKNDWDERAQWLVARNLAEDTPWWPEGTVTDWGSPAGDFANCFAAWATDVVSSFTPKSCDGTAELLEELANDEIVPEHCMNLNHPGDDTTTEAADDTGLEETDSQDTKPDDTGLEDTGLEDTGTEETAAEDTGTEEIDAAEDEALVCEDSEVSDGDDDSLVANEPGRRDRS